MNRRLTKIEQDLIENLTLKQFDMILSILRDTALIANASPPILPPMSLFANAPQPLLPPMSLPSYYGLVGEEGAFFDKWLNTIPTGGIIEGTNIIPSKAFLLNKKWTRHFNGNEMYHPMSVIKHYMERGTSIGMIVNLS